MRSYNDILHIVRFSFTTFTIFDITVRENDHTNIVGIYCRIRWIFASFAQLLVPYIYTEIARITANNSTKNIDLLTHVVTQFVT